MKTGFHPHTSHLIISSINVLITSLKNTFFGQKTVYKKLDPPRPKVLRNCEGSFQNLRNLLYRKQKLAKFLRILHENCQKLPKLRNFQSEVSYKNECRGIHDLNLKLKFFRFNRILKILFFQITVRFRSLFSNVQSHTKHDSIDDVNPEKLTLPFFFRNRSYKVPTSS